MASTLLPQIRPILRRSLRWGRPPAPPYDGLRGIATSSVHHRRMLTRLPGKLDGDELQELYQARKDWLASKKLPDSVDPDSVFASDEIHLRDIEAYGFDYDYTLAKYKTSVEKLIYDLAKNAMVDELKYPEVIRTFEYRPDSVIRGLHYDIEKGVLLKLDKTARIQFGSVYRGEEQLSDADVLNLFKKRHLPSHVVDPQAGKMVQLADTFSKPTMCLLSDLTSWFRQSGLQFVPESVYNDTTLAISKAHPAFHKVCQESPSEVLDNSSNEGLRALLQRFKDNNKVVFLCTNSPFTNLDGGMSYMLGSDWQQYFDLTIINAGKPGFFTNKRSGFREYSPKSDRLKWKPVTKFLPTKIYAGGTLFELSALTGFEPDRVLYFGDHVYADLADLRTIHGVRTAAVIQDLRCEIQKTSTDAFKQRVNWATILSTMIEEHQDSAKNDDDGRSATILQQWKEELAELRKTLKNTLNPKFGSVFRTERMPTYFAGRLFQFADLYMSDITNLNNYSLDHTFYPRRGALPHEFKSWFV